MTHPTSENRGAEPGESGDPPPGEPEEQPQPPASPPSTVAPPAAPASDPGTGELSSPPPAPPAGDGAESSPPAGPAEPEPAASEASAPIPPPPSTPGGRRLLLPLLAVVAVVAVGVGAFTLGRGSRGASGNGAAPTTTSTSARRTVVPADFETYTDEAAGFSIKLPKTWRKVPPDQLQTAADPPQLVASPGGLDYVSVRVNELEGTVGPDNVGDLKTVTDAIIQDAAVRVLDERSVTVNGLPGYYYLYTFTSGEPAVEGLHAHYFLFRGNKMHALVFQAMPSTGIRRLEPTFDYIRDSFSSKAPAG